MGLFSRGDKVRGWVQIVASSRAPYEATSGICRMQAVVQAEGVPAVNVEASRLCRVKKWPHSGMTYPCELDPRKPEDFKILWDEVPSWEDQARQQAAMMAQQMNQGGAGAAIPGLGALGGMIPGNVQVVNLSGGTPDADKIAKLEQVLGRDLDGDGRIGTAANAPAAAPMAAPPAPPDDRVAALERLAALRDKGVLTDAEFAAEKQRILGS